MKRIITNALAAVTLALVVGCSQSPEAQCQDYCARAASACSKFDKASCSNACAQKPDDRGTPDVGGACKKESEAYADCAKDAELTCSDDGATPKPKGCDGQWDALMKCATGGSDTTGGVGTGSNEVAP
ncbi:MAG: hypothetical protein HOO96_35740 [Polyangiaceae bacterium]|nr:hypothetical protein [Polyangiaceae bacterium]